jgi:hypothetical protein
MTGVQEYQRAKELADLLYANLDRRSQASVVAAVGRLYAELAAVAVSAAASVELGLPAAASEAWDAALGLNFHDNSRAAKQQNEPSSTVTHADADAEVDAAIEALFDPAVAERIFADEAIGALRWRVRQHCERHGHGPAYVLGYLLNGGVKSFAAQADNPAAYLAKQVKDQT